MWAQREIAGLEADVRRLTEEVEVLRGEAEIENAVMHLPSSDRLSPSTPLPGDSVELAGGFRVKVESPGVINVNFAWAPVAVRPNASNDVTIFAR